MIERLRRIPTVLREIQAALGAALAERGVQPPPILVESVPEIPRHPHSGKQKAIEVLA